MWKKEEKKQELFEATIVENFPMFTLDTKPHIQEALRMLSRVNAKTNKQENQTLRHIIVNWRKSKIKKNSWKNPEEKNTYV